MKEARAYIENSNPYLGKNALYRCPFTNLFNLGDVSDMLDKVARLRAGGKDVELRHETVTHLIVLLIFYIPVPRAAR